MHFSGYTLGRVAGIPIRVHGSLLILLLLMLLQVPLSLWPVGLAAAAGLFGSIALHEVGHSLVSAAFGCPARDIVLLPIGGVARLACLPRNPRHEMWIAAAGPAVSLGLAGGFTLVDAVSGRAAPALAAVADLLASVNLSLALFNLIPSFPLDGGRIFRAWLSPKIGRLLATRIASWIGQGFALLLVVWGLLPPMRLMTAGIGFFLFHAAGAEWRQTAATALRGASPDDAAPWLGPLGWGDPRRIDDDVVVGPPPYARRSFFARWRDRGR